MLGREKYYVDLEEVLFRKGSYWISICIINHEDIAPKICFTLRINLKLLRRLIIDYKGWQGVTTQICYLDIKFVSIRILHSRK